MAFYVQGMPSKKDASTQALSEILGKGLGEFAGSYFANKALDSVLNDASLKDAPVSERLSAMETKLRPFGERGKSMLASRLGLEKKAEEEGQQAALADIMDSYNNKKPINQKSLKKLTPEIQLKVQERVKSREKGDRIAENLKKKGVPEEEADYLGDMVADSEKGTGQSYAIQKALEYGERFGKQLRSESLKDSQGTGKFSKINPDFEFPEPEPITGRTAKEITSVKDKYAQENIKLDNENRTRLRSLKSDEFDYKKLDTLNPEISQGFDKWDINPLNGEPIIPAWANPAERQFAKIIVKQLRNAKDTFGARITNFDAQKYLEGFPSLADNPESRDAIIKDLQTVTEINRLYAEALDEVYDTYKVDGLSPSEAERIAEKMVRGRVDELYENYASNENVGPSGGLEVGEVMVEWKGNKYAVPQEEVDVWIQQGGKQL